MLDNCRYRLIIWFNFFDIYVRNEGCDWLRKKKEEILISCGFVLILRLAVFIFKFVEISVFVEKLYFLEILRNNSCIYDGKR